MSIVRGKNIALLINGKVVACGRDITFTTATSFIETTTEGSGKGATFYPQKNNTTANISGVTFLTETGKWTLPQLRSLQFRHTLIEDATIVRTDEDGDNYTDTFDFWITNISDSGAAGDVGNFTIDMQINGDPVITASCPDLSQPTNFVVILSTPIPAGQYTATWAWLAAYVMGDLSLEISTDGGVTWEGFLLGPGTTLTNYETTPTLVFTRNPAVDTAFKLKLIITCPFSADVTYELIFNYIP